MITKNRKDHAEYWKKADETAKEVAKWPKWKRDIQIGKIDVKNNSMTRVRTLNN